MLLNLNKALSKSALRHIFVGVGFVVVAMQTYLAKGNHLGYNTETFVGIGAQVLIALVPVAQRYIDKTDPALGSSTKEALALATAKLVPLTEPKPLSDGLPIQKAGVAPLVGISAPQSGSVGSVLAVEPVVLSAGSGADYNSAPGQQTAPVINP